MAYSNETKGFRLYDPTSKILFISHGIIFNEEKVWNIHDTLSIVNTSP